MNGHLINDKAGCDLDECIKSMREALECGAMPHVNSYMFHAIQLLAEKVKKLEAPTKGDI